MSYLESKFPALVRGDRGRSRGIKVPKTRRPCKSPYSGYIGSCKLIKNKSKAASDVDALSGSKRRVSKKKAAESKARKERIAELKSKNFRKKVKSGMTEAKKNSFMKKAELDSKVNQLDRMKLGGRQMNLDNTLRLAALRDAKGKSGRTENKFRETRYGMKDQVLPRDQLNATQKALDRRARKGKSSRAGVKLDYDNTKDKPDLQTTTLRGNPQKGGADYRTKAGKKSSDSKSDKLFEDFMNAGKKKKSSKPADDDDFEGIDDLILELDNKITRKPKSTGGPGKGKSAAQKRRDGDKALRDKGLSEANIATLKEYEKEERQGQREAAGFGSKKKSKKKSSRKKKRR